MSLNLTNFIQNLPRYFRRKESHSAIIFFSVLLCLYTLIVPVLVFEKKSEKELTAIWVKLTEFSYLVNEYNTLKAQVNAVDAKRSLSKISSIIQAVNDVSSSLGIKEKMKSIKGIEDRDLGGRLNEESADVQLEKITVNELINVLFKIENAPMLLAIKKVSMKKSFASPELLDVNMTISLFTGPSVNPE